MQKLSHKRYGPYKVLERIGSLAYRLELDPGLKIHDVFHSSRLSPHIPDTIPGRIPPQPPPLVIDGEEEWEVEEILDSQKKPRTRLPILRNMEYLVRWKGYGPEHNSWEPAENLENSPELVETFHRRFPNALRYH